MTRRFLPLFVLVCLLLAACKPYRLPPPREAASYCGMTEFEPEPDALVLDLWAAAPRQRCWRAFAPALASETLSGITVRPRAMIVSLNASINAVIDASNDPTIQAPDIAWINPNALPRFIEADLIIPFDDCRKRHPVFEQIQDSAWIPYGGEPAWGMPVANGLNTLFYSKTALSQLGWTDAEIDSLPERIRDGKFTLAQLLDTAEQAVEQKVVLPGMGLLYNEDHQQAVPQLLYNAHGGNSRTNTEESFHLDSSALNATYTTLHEVRQSNISLGNVVNLNAWTSRITLNDAKVQGEALFWVANIELWRYLEQDHAESAQFLLDTVGIALIPSATPGTSGSTLPGDPHMYVILSEQATGRANQTAACDLLAATLRTNHVGLYQLDYINFSVEKSPNYPQGVDPAAVQLLEGAEYMRAYEKGDRFVESDEYRALVQIMFRDNAILAETGELSSQEAVDKTVAELQTLLGERLRVDE